MKIEQGLLSDLSDEEASLLRQMAFAVVSGGEVSPEALAIMWEWGKAVGTTVVGDRPLATFTQIALLSLLVHEEDARRADAKIPEDDAEAQLKRLSRHFGEPVMPIRRYCDGLRAWERALHERAARKRAEMFPGIDGDYHKDPTLKAAVGKAWADYRTTKEKFADPWKAYRDAGRVPDKRLDDLETLKRYEDAANAAHSVSQAIERSSLLARTLYGGEKVRTRMCPEHKGEWDGQAMLSGCPHQCDGTGWLREP